MKGFRYPLLFVPLWASRAQALFGFSDSTMNKPFCASACHRILSFSTYDCTGGYNSHGHHDSGGALVTSPDCRATDEPYLTSLAYCLKTKCELSVAEIEQFWATRVTGQPGLSPQWSWGETMARITEEPTEVLVRGQHVNSTLVLPQDLWALAAGTMENFENSERTHAHYGIVVLTVSAFLPIAIRVLALLPFTTTFQNAIKHYIIYPTTPGISSHTAPLPYKLGNAPTIGQLLYILAFLLLNLIMSTIGYRSLQPNLYYPARYNEILLYSANRTGTLAMGLLPVVLLFAGRNNFLLYFTNWSHATFLLLHRWVARIFTVQVILHSILELVAYIHNGRYPAEYSRDYWIWGCVGTVAASLSVIVSVLWFRQKSYELFLITHIILAVFIIAGTWYHLWYLIYGYNEILEWLFTACAVWFFDRLIRVARVMKVGSRRARITEVSDGKYARVEVEGVRWHEWGVHSYVYFPSLTWRVWENHPFSVIPSRFLDFGGDRVQKVLEGSDEEKEVGKAEISTVATKGTDSPEPRSSGVVGPTGVVFYIRKSTGLTNYLKKSESMIVWLEGPYKNHRSNDILDCDRLLLLGGGIGITTLMSFLRAHPNTKLYWSIKAESEGLYADLKSSIDLSGAENSVKVGERFDFGAVIDAEAEQGWKKIGVIVCGPGGLCDSVRAQVVRVGRERMGRTVVSLREEAYSW